MISYCDDLSNLTLPWVKEGFSHCFLTTVTSSVLAGIALIFGGIQIYFYKRYATRLGLDQWQNVHSKRLYFVQFVLIFLTALESVVRLILNGTLIGNKHIYGVDILDTCATTCSWLMVAMLLYLESSYMLPSIPTRGHGMVILAFAAAAFVVENLAFVSWFSPQWWWTVRNSSTNVELGLWCWRYFCTAILFILFIIAPGIRRPVRSLLLDDDHGGLLNAEEGINVEAPVRRSAWQGLLRKISMLMPFVWPRGSILLQLCVLSCVGLLVAGRIVNLFTPLYYKKIVDSLTVKNVSKHSVTFDGDNYVANVNGIEFRWDYILTYVALWFLQGGGLGSVGFLNNFRSFLWTSVQQYTTRSVQVKLFSHLHGLSLRWHLNRKTGEVLRVMDRGTNSVNTILQYIVFSILPTIADILIAIVYFLTFFNAWFALIVFTTMAVYMIVTIVLTEWRTKFRRDMNKLDNEMNARAVDSLINFETVKYYGAEQFEVNRYQNAIRDYQRMEWISNSTLNLLNLAQNGVITLGLTAGTLLCAWYVFAESHNLTAGDYVLFSSYVVQLYSPLNWFGTYYRMIQQSFIDMENMFDLLKEQQEVKDSDTAEDLVVTKGSIEFSNVSFYYQEAKPILKNVSFAVPPGQTFALVGPSGAGKSTIIRLLFRFYDIQSGTIKIDDQDITKVKQSSLRCLIGVVPQDTVLFNNDIMYNVRYGRVTAEDDEVTEAARVADIHERILSFPEGYKTMVGERGLKLSGGEKQRVAIARTVLKSPQFILLDEVTVSASETCVSVAVSRRTNWIKRDGCDKKDKVNNDLGAEVSIMVFVVHKKSELQLRTFIAEGQLRLYLTGEQVKRPMLMFQRKHKATSALDTQTERNIQASFAKICENRTTLIVAHRLSTVIHANQIIVLKDGEVVERGTHDELLMRENGVYYGMWNQQQTRAEDEDNTASSVVE